MGIKDRFFTQYSSSGHVGALKDLVQRSMFYVSIVNLFIALAAYYAILKPYLLDVAPWMTIQIFFGAYLVFWIVVMVVEYKWIIPSTYAWANRQAYKHQNPVREDLVAIRKDLAELREMIEKLQTNDKQ